MINLYIFTNPNGAGIIDKYVLTWKDGKFHTHDKKEIKELIKINNLKITSYEQYSFFGTLLYYRCNMEKQHPD